MSLIVIEGVDGSGKETQTRLLVDWLRNSLGKEVSTFDFPGYYRSPFGRIIGHYLKGEYGDPVTMDPFETALLYAGDRMHSKKELLDALSKGNVVVLNRYVPSNLAYGCAKLVRLGRQAERDELVAFNEQLEYRAARLPTPNLVIVLDVESNVAHNLIAAKAPRDYLEGSGAAADKYEIDRAFQQQVRQEYLRLARVDGWRVINCADLTGATRSIEEIQQEMRSVVNEHLCVRYLIDR